MWTKWTLWTAAIAVVLCGVGGAQMTKAERKAERERVKQEQKLLDKQAKAEKKQKLQEAAALPTWTVIDASAGDLKGVLIQHMRAAGYSLEDESEHLVKFEKELSGTGELLAAGFAVGGDHPTRHIQFILTPDEGGKTRIDCQGEIISQGAFGRKNRLDMTNAARFKADVQSEYDALRSWAEHQKSVAKK